MFDIARFIRRSKLLQIFHRNYFIKFIDLLLTQELTKCSDFFKGVWGMSLPLHLLAAVDCRCCGC